MQRLTQEIADLIGLSTEFKLKVRPIKAVEWNDQDEDSFKALSKTEMDALRKVKPKSFTSINGWRVVAKRVVYTYSALVGGLIGFLPSALFLVRLEAAKKN
eukprot:gene48368-63365_t